MCVRFTRHCYSPWGPTVIINTPITFALGSASWYAGIPDMGCWRLMADGITWHTLTSPHQSSLPDVVSIHVRLITSRHATAGFAINLHLTQFVPLKCFVTLIYWSHTYWRRSVGWFVSTVKPSYPTTSTDRPLLYIDRFISVPNDRT